MRVGLNNRWGYSFKADSIVSLEQEAVLGANLARLDGDKCYFKDSIYKQDVIDKHWLPEDIQAIMGIGPKGVEKSIGVIWSMNQKHILEAMWYAAISEEYDCALYFYPYKVKPGKRYYIQDGEVYEVDAF